MQPSSYFIPTKARRGESLHKNLEIVVGALLLLSPMFWLFIAELIK